MEELKKILVTYAVQGELIEVKWPEAEIFYVRTGIGKVKSAFHLASVLSQFRPDLVLNIGSAGSLTARVGDVFCCRTFIDRDMEKLKDMGIEYKVDTTSLLESAGLCCSWTENGVCNTGDSFLTKPKNIKGDVFDMEAYAQAFVCSAREVPFISVKYVTDIIGQNSVKEWEERLADAREGLAHYVNELKKRI